MAKCNSSILTWYNIRNQFSYFHGNAWKRKGHSNTIESKSSSWNSHAIPEKGGTTFRAVKSKRQITIEVKRKRCIRDRQCYIQPRENEECIATQLNRSTFRSEWQIDERILNSRAKKKMDDNDNSPLENSSRVPVHQEVSLICIHSVPCPW